MQTAQHFFVAHFDNNKMTTKKRRRDEKERRKRKTIERKNAKLTTNHVVVDPWVACVCARSVEQTTHTKRRIIYRHRFRQIVSRFSFILYSIVTGHDVVQTPNSIEAKHTKEQVRRLHSKCIFSVQLLGDKMWVTAEFDKHFQFQVKMHFPNMKEKDKWKTKRTNEEKTYEKSLDSLDECNLKFLFCRFFFLFASNRKKRRNAMRKQRFEVNTLRHVYNSISETTHNTNDISGKATTNEKTKQHRPKWQKKRIKETQSDAKRS